MEVNQISQEQRQREIAELYAQRDRNLKQLRFPDRPDCTIDCEGNRLYLLWEILCPRSGFFRASFAGGFGESASGVLHLQGFVTYYYLWLIIEYIYLSVPLDDFHLQIYGPMSDADFYGLIFELYRQADYLRVGDLTGAIIKELKMRLNISAKTLFTMQESPKSEEFRKAYADIMTAVVFAFDKSKIYYDVYEPVRAMFFGWIERCYPVLRRIGDDFDNYLRRAPELSIIILNKMHHIEKSQFISPGPEARCMFCNECVWDEFAALNSSMQPKFGVLADGGGGVKYICARSACFRQMSAQKCFKA